ncbi:hypothetical protein HETIRDRAFT_436628 [Heterobasidion irregulare TC 32-1]|uniref:Uncharacterized protein n=1 Tax=Heterobasidion irregulare (strain TC 32-1) TaxID=747525 RepID=W4JTB4_HETIT|nr:uncharacterized protein HETIRDRAFT_436628 [Heterobasidion irregulare TC 32-1]ETW76782.1 hypothetical protein HETIRDRAFT_436628 [Heterobasidion irregulare TC 32-1]
MAIENFAMQRDWELERWGADADADAVGAVYEDEDAYGDAHGDGGDGGDARDAPPHMPVRAATPNNRAPSSASASASSCSSSSCYDTDSSASASPSLSASEYDSDGDGDSDADAHAPQKPLPASPSQSRIAVRGHAAALFGRLLGTSARKGGACAAPAHVPVKSARRTSVCAQNGVGRSGSAGGDSVGSGRQRDRGKDRDRGRSWIAAGLASVRNMWTLGV